MASSKTYVGAVWTGDPTELPPRRIVETGETVSADVIGEGQAVSDERWKPLYESAAKAKDGDS
jgi:hypothetical protein